MKRQLFNLTAGLSLVMFLATAALWARSRFTRDEVDYVRRGMHSGKQSTSTWFVRSARGWLRAGWDRFQGQLYTEQPERDPDPYGLHVRSAAVGDSPPRGGWEFATRNEAVDGADAIWIQLPFWLMVALFGIVPSAWLVDRWRPKDANPGNLCPVCGYDLRATPARCPECGTVPEASGETRQS